MQELCVELCGMERSWVILPGSWISAEYFSKTKFRASITLFLGPNGIHFARCPFGAQKIFQWPSKWICPHQNHYVPRHINNRYINSWSLYIQEKIIITIWKQPGQAKWRPLLMVYVGLWSYDPFCSIFEPQESFGQIVSSIVAEAELYAK